MDNCPFCMIVRGEIPALVMDENDDVTVFLSLENHPLVVPKKHITDIFSLDEDTGTAIMSESIKVAKATRVGLDCDGIYVTQSNGASAGQEVFHYHMHIYPRWEGGNRQGPQLGRQEMAEKIREAL